MRILHMVVVCGLQLLLALPATKSFGFTVAYDEAITSLNPYRMTGVTAWQVSKLAFEFLCNEDSKTKTAQPALAKSWKISKDKLTYTFFLRQNVKWHDGKPFTAEDVAFTLNSLRDPDYGGQAWAPMYSAIDSVKVIDKHTVAFSLSEAKYANWEQIAYLMRIYPKHFYTNENKKNWSRKILGTGPYSLEKFVKGRYLIFKRNPQWWKSDVHLPKKLVIRFESEPQRIKELIQKGALDFKSVDSSQIKKIRKDSKLNQSFFLERIPSNQDSSISAIMVHMKDPILAEHNVRIALNHLWDRQLIANKLLLANTQLASSSWPQEKIPVSFKAFSYNPKKALQLLHSAGWKDRNSDGVLENSSGKKTDLECTLRPK